MKIEFNVLAGPLKGKRFLFDEYNKITVGRSSKNYFSFPDDQKISRFHCIIEIAPPCNCYVKDLESRNGTSIKHSDENFFQKISEAHVKNDDEMKIGDSVFKISWAEIPSTKVCDKCGQPILAEQYARGDASVWDGKTFCVKCRGSGELTAGKRIGSFEVVRKLGEGGVGIVYLVRHLATENSFAIKILRPNIQPNETQVQRFLREAACGVEIKHKNVVRYYSPGYAPNGFFYIPMEYVPGMDFQEYLKKRNSPLRLSEVKGFIFQLLDALECIHNHNIVHRDIKPSNILFFREKENKRVCIKVTDLGLAKNYEEAGLSGLTLSNRIIGTPLYMAPEQLNDAKRVDPRADIYSTGATIYYLLTRSFIYNNTNSGLLIAKIMMQEPIPLQEVNPDIPEDVASVIMQCLKKDPEERFQTVDELRKEFKKVL